MKIKELTAAIGKLKDGVQCENLSEEEKKKVMDDLMQQINRSEGGRSLKPREISIKLWRRVKFSKWSIMKLETSDFELLDQLFVLSF